MDKLMKLMQKKKQEGKELSPMEKASKMSMLRALSDEMSGLMKEDLHGDGMKKVEVASNDEEGLKAGLEKAKDLLESKEDEESEEHEASESPEEEYSEHSDDKEKALMDAYHANPSKENLENLMACLEKKKSVME